jgi:hypothetical protein
LPTQYSTSSFTNILEKEVVDRERERERGGERDVHKFAALEGKGILKDDVLHIKSEALISAACCIECISK